MRRGFVMTSTKTYYTEFYRLPKETYIGIYGQVRYDSCLRGAIQVKHYVDAGVQPVVKQIARQLGTNFAYAKAFITTTLDVMERRGLKTV